MNDKVLKLELQSPCVPKLELGNERNNSSLLFILVGLYENKARRGRLAGKKTWPQAAMAHKTKK
jgi:hypothetical protein